MTRTAADAGGSRIRREARELVKLVGALVVVALAFVLVANFWPDGFDGPVDSKRLTASGDALGAARPDLDAVTTTAGTVDRGTKLMVGCHMGDSVPIGPSLSRVWTAGSRADLDAASRQASNDLVTAGWSATGSPSETLTRVSRNIHGHQLVAEIEVHDYAGQQRDLTVHVYVNGPDGCTS